MLALSNYVRDCVSSHWSKWAPGFKVGWLRYHDQLTAIGNECTTGGDQKCGKIHSEGRKKVWRRTLSRWGGTHTGKECRLGSEHTQRALEAFTVTVQELKFSCMRGLLILGWADLGPLSHSYYLPKPISQLWTHGSHSKALSSVKAFLPHIHFLFRHSQKASAYLKKFKVRLFWFQLWFN